MLTHSHRWHGLFTKLFRKSSCRQGAVQGLYGIRWKWEEILAGVSGPESSPNSLRESCMRLGKSLPLFQTWFLLQLNEVYITNHLHLMILWTCILELAQTLILFINSIITIWLIVLSRSLWPAEPRLAFGLCCDWQCLLAILFLCFIGWFASWARWALFWLLSCWSCASICPHEDAVPIPAGVTTPESWLAILALLILWEVLLRGPVSRCTPAWQSGAWFRDFVFMDPNFQQEILFNVLTVLCSRYWLWFLSQG